MEKSLQPILTEIESVFQTTILQVSEPMSGCNHTVYVLTLPHSIQWSLRIAKNESAASASASASLAARSIAIMRHIKQMDPALHQIPNVIFSAEKYSVLEYLGGNAIGFGVWDVCSLPRSRRERILDGLAEVLWRLWRCLSVSLPLSASSLLSMSISTTTTTTTTTYRSWLLHEVDLGIRRSIKNSGWGDPLHFLLRRAKVDSLLPSIACPCGDDSLGCLAIRHGDLNPLNVLVDDEGRLTGYVHIILYHYRNVLSLSLSLSEKQRGKRVALSFFFSFFLLPFLSPFFLFFLPACLPACLFLSTHLLLKKWNIQNHRLGHSLLRPRSRSNSPPSLHRQHPRLLYRRTRNYGFCPRSRISRSCHTQVVIFVIVVVVVVIIIIDIGERFRTLYCRLTRQFVRATIF